MTFVPPMERTVMRHYHRKITTYARHGLYAKAELCLLNAPAEYQAIIALCRYVVRLKYAGKTIEQAQVQDAVERNVDAPRATFRKPVKRAHLALVPPVPQVMRGGA